MFICSLSEHSSIKGQNTFMEIYGDQAHIQTVETGKGFCVSDT